MSRARRATRIRIAWATRGRTLRRSVLAPAAGVVAAATVGALLVSTAHGGRQDDAQDGRATSSATDTQQSAATYPGRVGAWESAMSAGGPSFHDQTVRMVVHTSIGGSGLRIRVSDLRSDRPLTVGAADVAEQYDGGRAVAGTHHRVTFGGSRSTTVAAGREEYSDVIPMRVAADQNLLVSLYLSGTTGPSTFHREAYETTYVSTDGVDHAADDSAAGYARTRTSWYYLSGLDVVAPTAHATVVAFGDSITDGYHSTAGANRRWPDQLARRLASAPGGQRLGVTDAGIAGNRLLTTAPEIYRGPSGVQRFDHDALGEPGVKDVILLEGVNDLSNDLNSAGGPLTARNLIDGYRTLIARGHADGVRMIGATILPYSRLSPAMNAVREQVNQWIRSSGAFDAVVDFDRAVRDPSNPDALAPAYDSGDHLHPNDAGMLAMADAVDLSVLVS
ncbi:SGNH/GDSL hydrolase family protein [Actinacidiphila reveromycinica]|uniref:SGNH/GDSL hydrolase family protein n=1 Tax=Actinacidiphila reveromycinica TaxID=659352 RepID=UPI00192383C8|nr:SGNH/GDSL hydrolase family protein [Streptomyces sp. SN-593]